MLHLFFVYIQSTEKEQKEAMKARINLKAIESLTYTCTDPQLLKQLNSQLQGILNEFRGSLPEEEGLVILPAVREQAECTMRKKRLKNHLSLPLLKKRGRKRLDSAYRKRVGRKANALRNVSAHYTHTCCQLCHVIMFM